MTILLVIVTVCLGIFFSIQTIAAWYGIIDHWFTIKTAWSRILRNLVVWTGLTAAVALVLNDPFQTAFLWGLGGYAAFYILTFPTLRLILDKLGKPTV